MWVSRGGGGGLMSSPSPRGPEGMEEPRVGCVVVCLSFEGVVCALLFRISARKRKRVRNRHLSELIWVSPRGERQNNSPRWLVVVLGRRGGRRVGFGFGLRWSARAGPRDGGTAGRQRWRRAKGDGSSGERTRAHAREGVSGYCWWTWTTRLAIGRLRARRGRAVVTEEEEGEAAVFCFCFRARAGRCVGRRLQVVLLLEAVVDWCWLVLGVGEGPF
jgi:hypothetical protein